MARAPVYLFKSVSKKVFTEPGFGVLLGKFEHGTLAPGLDAENADVFGVFHAGNDARRQRELGPRLVEIENVHSVLATLENVRLHGARGVARAQMGLASQKLRNVFFRGLQRVGEP